MQYFGLTFNEAHQTKLRARLHERVYRELTDANSELYQPMAHAELETEDPPEGAPNPGGTPQPEGEPRPGKRRAKAGPAPQQPKAKAKAEAKGKAKAKAKASPDGSVATLAALLDNMDDEEPAAGAAAGGEEEDDDGDMEDLE